MVEKIFFMLDGYREFALVDMLDDNGDPTGTKKLTMKLDGIGIVKGEQTDIQIQFEMLEIDTRLLLEDLVDLKKRSEKN